MRKLIYLVAAVLALFVWHVALAKALSLLGVLRVLNVDEWNFALGLFLIGVGGGVVSWLLSRSVGNWSVNARPYADADVQAGQSDLRPVVARLAPRFGLKQAPPLTVYESREVNAFAVGAIPSRSDVVVTSSLVSHLTVEQAEVVLAHELARIASGDVATLLLVQGLVNVFTVFPSRMLSLLLGTALRTADEETPSDETETGMRWTLELVLAFLAGLVARHAARSSEVRADRAAAAVVGDARMARLLADLGDAPTGPTTREMFSAPLNFRGRVARGLRLLSHQNPVAYRLAALARRSGHAQAAEATRHA